VSTDAAADGPVTDGVAPDSAGGEATRARPPMGSVGRGASVMAAGTLASRLRGSRRAANVSRYVSGSILIGLGALAAVSGRRQA